jgi:hypothetical protein
MYFQEPDYIWINGGWHCLTDYPLKPLIKSLQLYPGPGGVCGTTTGCSRGHVGFWQYENGQLWLLDVRDPMDLSISQTWLPDDDQDVEQNAALDWLAGHRPGPLAVTWITNVIGFVAAYTDAEQENLDVALLGSIPKFRHAETDY